MISTVRGTRGALYRRFSPTAWARQQRSYQRFVADGGDALRVQFPELDGTLMDVGGHEGRWTASMLERYPRCRVYVFEPVAASAERLKRRFDSDERVTVFDFALGAGTRTETISIAGDRSSIYRGSGSTSAEPVRVVDIVEWWNDAGAATADVMKINIEGGEFEVLPRLIESGLISRIAHVQVQFHSFVPGATWRMRKILKQLGRTHEPVYRYPFIWESWRRRRVGD